MRSEKLKGLTLAIATLACVLSMEGKALAQDLITPEALNEWFFSRLILAVIVGVVAGFAISWGHLCRLRFPYAGALNVNSSARRKLSLWIVTIFCVAALLLFIDTWFLFPFGPLGLRLGEVLSQVWINYRMLAVLLTMIFVILLVVAIATRLTPRCRCRYFLISGPSTKTSRQ